MANQGKHSRSPLADWLEGEDGTTPTKSRGAHVVDPYVKKGKVAVKKPGKRAAPAGEPKPDPALAREAAVPAKPETKSSQSASWDHQRRMERLGQLRAPYQYRTR
jgi:hypothetical protein